MKNRQMIDYFELRDFIQKRQDSHTAIAGADALAALTGPVDEREARRESALKYKARADELETIRTSLQRLVERVEALEEGESPVKKGN